MEQYSRGLRDQSRKLADQEIDARVRISPAPPEIINKKLLGHKNKLIKCSNHLYYRVFRY